MTTTTTATEASALTVYNYPWLLPFEDGAGLHAFSLSIVGDWRAAFVVLPLYVGVVAALQRWMRSRPAVRAQRWLLTWNLLHCFVSLLAAARTFPEIRFAVGEHGLRGTLLAFPPLFSDEGQVTLFWFVVFAWCKVIELGDTVFLVLRKKPVTALHGFHHGSTLVASWYGSVAPELAGLFRWIMCVNFFVHFWMYGYFALTTHGVRLHPAVARTITQLQIAQMLFILYLVRHLFDLVNRGLLPTQQRLLVNVLPLLGTLNLALFLNYYYQTYLRRQRQEQPKTKAH